MKGVSVELKEWNEESTESTMEGIEQQEKNGRGESAL